jgi:transcriptional regulator with XRE-family HTH domain
MPEHAPHGQGFTGSRLSLARRRRGFSQEELARLLDVSRAEVRFWERGDAEPTAEAVAAMSWVLGFPAAFFSMEPPPHIHIADTSLAGAEIARLRRTIRRLRRRLAAHA